MSHPKGIKFDNSDLEVSLLQYADDAILMGEWDRENAKNMVRVLKCFEICSGLKINLGNSSVIGVGVSKEEISRMATRLKCKSEPLPFKYLGLPVGSSMAKTTNWQPVIDKFNMRLSNWKAKQLSIGGRLCLCKSVLGSLSTYYFSLYKAPRKALHYLERIRRKFFWGCDNRNNKISWVAWDRILSDRKKGGLAVGSLRALNLAMLGKWWWRDRTESSSIWRLTVHHCNETHCRNGSNRGIWGGIKSIETDLAAQVTDLNNFWQQNEKWH